MRSGKSLILATKFFAQEDRKKSWIETLLTLSLIIVCFSITLLELNIFLRLFASILCGFLYVRMFIIYHDYQHHAILQQSWLAEQIMTLFGLFILAPKTIWKRSHDHHHNHNSKLTITGIGSYPTISKEKFLKLTPRDQKLYLLNRHPIIILMGYFSLFIYWLNVRSYLQSPKNHLDSLFALVIHFLVGGLIWYFLGITTFFITWTIPFFLAFAMGSYLFYSQHNFPDAKFRENADWSYDNAALASTSYMQMNPVMSWFTGYIGYHHVHHMNSKIPFYRLKETMEQMPELQSVSITSWNPVDMYRCFRLKLWDPEKDRMIGLNEL